MSIELLAATSSHTDAIFFYPLDQMIAWQYRHHNPMSYTNAKSGPEKKIKRVRYSGEYAQDSSLRTKLGFLV